MIISSNNNTKIQSNLSLRPPPNSEYLSITTIILRSKLELLLHTTTSCEKWPLFLGPKGDFYAFCMNKRKMVKDTITMIGAQS